MGRVPPLHPADELLVPAVDELEKALGLPAADLPLLVLARLIAGTLDRMSRAEQTAMLGQTAPLFLKVLVEVDRRAVRRAAPVKRPPNQLEKLRAARARSDAARGWTS